VFEQPLFNGKAISVIYSECVSTAFGIEHARHVVISALSWCTVFFAHYLINGTIIETSLLNTKCVIFSTTFVWNISHSKRNWVRHDKKMHTGLHVKQPFFLSDFNKTCIFSTYFLKIHIKFHKKISPVGAEFFHTKGWTGRQTWWS
jgi:hypothetical protein